MGEKKILKIIGQAINDYDMINENDRIVIGLSGGIDSITLLILMLKRLKYIPIKYELFPVIIDYYNGEHIDYSNEIKILIDYFKYNYNLEIGVIKIPAIEKLTNENISKKNICYYCSYRRRVELIKYAFQNNCQKIALGHHKDDIVETSLLNLFYKRELSTMLPRLPIFNGKLEIIRPLAYLSKKQIERYYNNCLSDIKQIRVVCPLKELDREQRREKIRKIIKYLKTEIPEAVDNIFASFRNPKIDYLLNYKFNPKKSGKFKRP